MGWFSSVSLCSFLNCDVFFVPNVCLRALVTGLKLNKGMMLVKERKIPWRSCHLHRKVPEERHVCDAAWVKRAEPV